MNTSGTDDGPRLAELLATRLCHDLSSPLNGISAGLAEIAGPSGADGLALARDATRIAIGRLRLYRAAWGEPGETLDRSALVELATGLPGRRVHLDCAALASGVSFSPSAGRLLLNVLILCAESLPRGGTVKLLGDMDRGIVAAIEGPQAAWPDGLAGLIAAPDSAHAFLGTASPRALQAPLTVLIAASAGLRLSLLLGNASQMPPPLLIGVADDRKVQYREPS